MADNKWIETDCPVCTDSSEFTPFMQCSDRFREPRFLNYQLVRCGGCGMIYLNPRPNLAVVSDIYQDKSYDPFLSTRNRPGWFERMYKTARTFTLRWKKRLVMKLVEPGSTILDYGCGTGEFISVLKDEYRIEGFEPDIHAAEWAIKNLQVNIHHGTLDTVKLHNNPYQLATMWHVLEHLSDPLGSLKKIHTLTADGGYMLIAVPNIASLDAKLYRSAWVAIDAPRHIWHFTRKDVTSLAGKAGFVLHKTGMLPLDPFYNILLSERLRNEIRGRANMIISLLRVPFITAASLAFGIITGEHSSRYYVFRKA